MASSKPKIKMRNATISFVGGFKSEEFNRAKECIALLNFPGCETWISKNYELKISMSSRDDIVNRFFGIFQGALKLRLSPEFHWENEKLGYAATGSATYPNGLVAYQVFHDGEIIIDGCPFEIYEKKNSWIARIHGLLQINIAYSKSLYASIEDVYPEIQKEINKITLKGVINERDFFWNHKDRSLKSGYREYIGDYIF